MLSHFVEDVMLFGTLKLKMIVSYVPTAKKTFLKLFVGVVLSNKNFLFLNSSSLIKSGMNMHKCFFNNKDRKSVV